MSILDEVGKAISHVEGDLAEQAMAAKDERVDAVLKMTNAIFEIDTQWEEVKTTGESMFGAADRAMGWIEQVGGKLSSHANEVRSGIDGAMEQGSSLFESCRGVVEALDHGVQELIPDCEGVMGKVGEIDYLSDRLEKTRAYTDNHLHTPFQGVVDDQRLPHHRGRGEPVQEPRRERRRR